MLHFVPARAAKSAPRCEIPSHDDAVSFWEQFHDDMAWPLVDASCEGFARYVYEMVTAETVGWGMFRWIVQDDRTIGYVVLHEVASMWLLPDVTAVEGGTYLIPTARGQGLNPIIKKWQATSTRHRFQADWCLYVVPVANARASAAFGRLPWRVHEEDGHRGGPFAVFLRRKAWELGKPCKLYALSTHEVLDNTAT